MAFLAIENASSSSLSIPPSSTSVCKYEYDVFLNFRGTDTRKNFTDHLYDGLKQQGIFTFRDDERLEQGTDINSGLLRAIDESKIAVVVLSKQYASSSGCLIELAKIVECKVKKKLTVFPVFHDVDPSDVRKQRGSFAEAFAKHENRFKDKIDDVKTWRAALTEVANLSGWLLKDNSESEVIKEIIQVINSELDREVPFVSKHLVGMDSRVKQVLDLCLGERLNCVCVVGICGMGGIGKTTLAREIYNRIFCDFEVRRFIAGVREKSESLRLVSLQKNILSKILMGEEKYISDVEEGKKILRNRLCNKKVLIVLDDVNNEEQLKALAGKDWFGPGSIIIVTSRDIHLLIRYWDGMIDIYNAKKLNDDEALELFSLKAFKKSHPKENYVYLSKIFVSYANGLPLALRVLGSSLFGKTLDAWISALDKLKAKPNRDIMDVLELSVDGLDYTQRDLFLDIAFLLKDMDDYCIRDTLESLGHYTYDIDVLQDKSLITIALDGALWMHDLVKEMGQDIIRRKSELGKRSRLWSYKDVLHVLTSNAGTKADKSIMRNMPIEAKECLSVEAFSKMKILRFLKLGHVHPPQDLIGGRIQLPQGLSYLPNELHIIDWHGYPLKSMPTRFQLNKLVELRMGYNRIKQLWKGIMTLNELKLIDPCDSQNLIEIPDLSGSPNLEQLIFNGCTRLSNIHSSLGNLKQLIQLDMSDCRRLNSLPRKINLEALEFFNLSGCSKLKKFPYIVENMPRLQKLCLSETAIKDLSLLVIHSTGLVELDLRDCKNLSSLPIAICSLMSLKTLNLSGCSKLDELPENLGKIKGLEVLNLSGTAIRGLPSSNIKFIDARCTSLETSSLRLEYDFQPALSLLYCEKLITNQGCSDLFSTMLGQKDVLHVLTSNAGIEVVEIPHLDSDRVDLAAMVPFHPVDQKDKGSQSPPSQLLHDWSYLVRKEVRWIGQLNLNLNLKPLQLLIIDWRLKMSPSQLLIIDLELMMSRKLESLPMMMDWGIKLPSQMRVMMLPSQMRVMMNLDSQMRVIGETEEAESPRSSTKLKRLYLKIVESEIKEAESLPSELLAGPSERNKLYFFFWHAYSPVMYSLYEVDVPIPLPPPPSKADQDDRISNPRSLSPILQLKTGKYADGMCCVQLGSILYFLGGEMNMDNPYIDEDVKKEFKNVKLDVLPKVVYIFDLAIDREVKDNDDLLTSTPMNYGKASPLAFVADEKIYVIGSTIQDLEGNRIPYFEMFDPKVDKWSVLKNSPEINVNTIWVGHAVVGRKALLVGWQQGKKRLYCFDLDTCEWANISIPYCAGNLSGNIEFVGNTLYGCYYKTIAAIAPLVGEEKDELKEEEEKKEEAREEDFQQMFKHHRLLQVSEEMGMDAIFNVPPQLQCSSSLLHLGKMYFCYVRTGMPPHPDPILASDLVIGDDKKRFISIVIFQAMGKTCGTRFFRAKFLHSEHYVVHSPFPNDGFIRGCYVFGWGSAESSKQISV